MTPLASAGWAGVDVFYVLSGFLLWGVFDDWAMGRSDSPSLARFAERRAMRILPPYYAQVGLLAVLGLATTWVEPPTPTTLALNLTMTHGLSLQNFQAVNGVWWTLSTEAQFYVLLPLLAWSVRRWGWGRVLAAGIATMLAWRIGVFALFHNDSLLTRIWILEQLPGRIDQFLLGMFASHLARSPAGPAARLRSIVQSNGILRRTLAGLAPLALIGLAYLLHVEDFYLRYWAGHPWIYAWHLVAGLAVAISLYAIAVRPGRGEGASKSRVGRVAVALGVISYSFYLWHELLLRWFSTGVKGTLGAATPATFAVNLAGGLILSVAVATLWYAMFERPFLRARRRLRSASPLEIRG